MNDTPLTMSQKPRPRWLPGEPVAWAAALICGAFALAGEAGRLLLRYDRAAIEAGQLWRLASAHFVHLGWMHTLMNVAALGLVAALFDGVLTRRDWLLGTLAAVIAIDAGFYWLQPQLVWYVGLSGVLHGLVLLGGLRLLGVQRVLATILLVGLAAKLGWELIAGPTAFSESVAQGPVVVAAHAFGAGGAAAYAAIEGLRRNARRPV